LVRVQGSIEKGGKMGPAYIGKRGNEPIGGLGKEEKRSGAGRKGRFPGSIERVGKMGPA
jgi:hypothetical protein